jgi:hypothetical protein
MMLVLTLVSVALLAYKVIEDVPCTPFQITSKGYNAGSSNSFYLGHKVTFTASGEGSSDLTWDFGDHTKEETGNTISHVFTKEGTYIVSAGTNEKCTESITISITGVPAASYNIDLDAQNPIEAPDASRAGEPINLVCKRTASSYEWSVLNNPTFPLQTGNIASYLFPTPGTITVVLKLDNDPKKEYRKTIQVLPPMRTEADFPVANGPSANQPAPTTQYHIPREKAADASPDNEEEGGDKAKAKTIIIPSQEFASMFRQATEGKKDLESFNQFLCSGAQTKVLANDTEWETVGSFYAKTRGKKKYEIVSVDAVRDDQSCVTILKIKYKKKTLGIF